MMMRQSKYIFAPKNKHFLRGENIFFTILVDNREIFVRPDCAYKYSIDQLRDGNVEIASSKADQNQMGHRFCFKKGEATQLNRVFDIALVLPSSNITVVGLVWWTKRV